MEIVFTYTDEGGDTAELEPARTGGFIECARPWAGHDARVSVLLGPPQLRELAAACIALADKFDPPKVTT